MKRCGYGELTTRLLEAMADLGPMTRTELCEALGIERRTAASIVTRLMRPRGRPVAPRRVRIAGWRDDAEGERRYLRAVYGLGSEPDARKPDVKARALASKRRYWQRRKTPNSVFALGGTQ